MKAHRNIFIGIAFIVLMVVAFLVGSFMREQEYTRDRKEHCVTLVSFALNKLENEDISDQNVMEAMISNVYAAYQFCDDPILAMQLHDLWNALIRESDVGIRDIALQELQSILNALTTSE